MSDVVSDDDLNALAAEYVLGTLDYEERKGATALLEVDPAFRGIVHIWERRFGDLHLMVEAVDPDPELWARIKPKIAGIEQVPLAIPPSPADEADAAAAAAPPAAPADAAAAAPALTEASGAAAPADAVASAAPRPEAAAATPPADAASATLPADTANATLPADADAEPSADAAPPADAPVADTKPVEVTPAEAKPAEAKPAEAKPAEAKPDVAAAEPMTPPPAPPAAPDAVPPAVVEAELKLAELAALLPVAEHATTQPEPTSEDGLYTHAADSVPRGFVPPAPMSTRGSPMVVEVPVRQGNGGWVAATLVMGLVAVALAGLISAWRFIPERLPAQLRATTVLNLAPSPQEPEAKERPPLPPFDE
jgi:anti-sigma-K factor RskA